MLMRVHFDVLRMSIDVHRIPALTSLVLSVKMFASVMGLSMRAHNVPLNSSSPDSSSLRKNRMLLFSGTSTMDESSNIITTDDRGPVSMVLFAKTSSPYLRGISAHFELIFTTSRLVSAINPMTVLELRSS